MAVRENSQDGAKLRGNSPRRLVLLFSDNEASIRAITRSLSAIGIEVRASADPEKFSGGPMMFGPKAIIIDHSNSALESRFFEIVGRLNTSGRLSCPVIFIGDPGIYDLRIRSVEAGCSAFIERPYDVLDLVNRVEKLTRDDIDAYRILVVDDSKTQTTIAQTILEAAGMTVSTLNDPNHILTILKEFHPELILMDLNMPDASGQTVARMIRQEDEFAAIPIVFLSGEQDIELQQDAMANGAEDFLIKPYLPERLIKTVQMRVPRFRELRQLIECDSLTGLKNHTSTFRLLGGFLESAAWDETEEAPGLETCLIGFDLDHFKSVNDTWGHPVGDQVIVAFAHCLRRHSRTGDVVGRVGGEEFIMILSGADEEIARQRAEEIRTAFAEMKFYAGDDSFGCTTSIGVASSRIFGTEQILRDAVEAALYLSKSSGRNRTTIAHSGLEAMSSNAGSDTAEHVDKAASAV